MSNKGFKSHHGTYLCEKSPHLATQSNVNHLCRFYVEHQGNVTKLRTYSGMQVGVKPDKTIYLTSYSTPDINFYAEHHHGKVAFKTHHGGYLSVDKDGHLHIHHERGHHESSKKLL